MNIEKYDVCLDCASVINFGYDVEVTQDISVIESAMTKAEPVMGYWLEGMDQIDDFSKCRCELCNSRLFGGRYRVAKGE